MTNTQKEISEADVEDAGASNEFKMSVLGMKPNFPASASMLNSLHGTVLDGKTDALKSLFKGNSPGMLKACIEVVSTVKEEHPVQYVLMTIFEGCRTDSSLNEVITESAKSKHAYHLPWYEPNQAMVRTMRTMGLVCGI